MPLPTGWWVDRNAGIVSRMSPEQKKANVRLALILASVVLVFFGGFMVKMVFLGG